ncbi:hypothetical protein FALBO_1545 [Fusarium albosuccineum]|uniref:Uncharacterized protein n=1 Tax=Fusarium albosuccineum TaxID=1237068 RepID=A0A8H4PHJ6_9HYPO|nr:hypothetical protein FALBO_1545 [Fusarium albosuccineum]
MVEWGYSIETTRSVSVTNRPAGQLPPNFDIQTSFSATQIIPFCQLAAEEFCLPSLALALEGFQSLPFQPASHTFSPRHLLQLTTPPEPNDTLGDTFTMASSWNSAPDQFVGFDMGGQSMPEHVDQLRLVGVLDPWGFLVAMRFQNPSGGPSTEVVASTPGPNSPHVFTYQGAGGGVQWVGETVKLLSTSGETGGIVFRVSGQRTMERDLPAGYRKVYLRQTVFDPQNLEAGVPMAMPPTKGDEVAMVRWPTDTPLVTGILPPRRRMTGIRLIYVVDGTPEEEEEPAAAQNEEPVAGQVEEEAGGDDDDDEDDEDDEDYEPMSDESEDENMGDAVDSDVDGDDEAANGSLQVNVTVNCQFHADFENVICELFPVPGLATLSNDGPLRPLNFICDCHVACSIVADHFRRPALASSDCHIPQPIEAKATNSWTLEAPNFTGDRRRRVNAKTLRPL